MINRTEMNGSDFVNKFDLKVEKDPENIDRYTKLILIGEGGISRVYKAFDPELNRTVAIKILRKGVASSGKIRQRFEQEITVQSNLNLNGCAKIFDSGEENDNFYCVMEFIDGVSLDKLIKQNNLTFKQKTDYLYQLADIIKNLHEKGFEHRDIKPANIIIDKQNHVKLLDFGLARAIEENQNIYSTVYGEFFGTPAYMSPEQTDTKYNKPSKFCSDIYSLGVTAYELFTGHLPYNIKHLGNDEISYVIQNDPPIEPKTYNNDIPDNLESAILKTLDKNPNYRPNAGEFFSLIKEIKHTVSGKKPKFNRLFFILTGCAAALIIICSIIFYKTQNVDNITTTPNNLKVGNALNTGSFTLPNLDINMVKINSGSFVLQNPASKRIFLTKSFYISSHEITVKQYNKVPVQHKISENNRTSKIPVAGISWHDAMSYCRLLTAREKEAGRLPEGMVYRLPTAAEWEYACGGGSKDIYYYGNMKERLPLYAVHNSESVHPVGSRKPNKFGLYDTLGNVWEWCYDSKGKSSLFSVINPVINGESHDEKMIRGGGFGSSSDECTIASMKYVSPHSRNIQTGFRIVLGYKLQDF